MEEAPNLQKAAAVARFRLKSPVSKISQRSHDGTVGSSPRRRTEYFFDQYPYPFGSTTLTVVLPPRAVEGGADKMPERLESKQLRARMKDDIKRSDRFLP